MCVVIEELQITFTVLARCLQKFTFIIFEQFPLIFFNVNLCSDTDPELIYKTAVALSF